MLIINKMRIKNMLVKKVAFSTFIITVLFSFVFVKLTLAVPVFVNIRDVLEGSFPYDNLTYNNGIATINAIWENLGSVTCDAYLRVDVLDNQSEVLDTFWSNEQEVTPGSSGVFHVYIYLKNYTGNLTLEQRYYYCNEITKLKTFNITYNSTHVEYMKVKGNNSNSMINLTYAYVNDSYVLINLTTSPLNTSAYIIPEKTPIGWVVQSKKINIINGKGQAYLYINKPQKSTDALHLYVLLSNKNNTQVVYEKTIELIKEQKPKKYHINWLELFSLIANVVLFLMLILLIIRHIRISKIKSMAQHEGHQEYEKRKYAKKEEKEHKAPLSGRDHKNKNYKGIRGHKR